MHIRHSVRSAPTRCLQMQHHSFVIIRAQQLPAGAPGQLVLQRGRQIKLWKNIIFLFQTKKLLEQEELGKEARRRGCGGATRRPRSWERAWHGMAQKRLEEAWLGMLGHPSESRGGRKWIQCGSMGSDPVDPWDPPADAQGGRLTSTAARRSLSGASGCSRGGERGRGNGAAQGGVSTV